MDLTQLSPNVLSELLKLSQEKLALTKKIEEINSKIVAISSGKRPAASPKAKRKSAKAAPTPKRAAAKAAPLKKPEKKVKQKPLKDDILALLGSAGAEGVSVKEISKRLGRPNQNIHVWFGTTAKNIPSITKVGPARYALVQPVAVRQPEA